MQEQDPFAVIAREAPQFSDETAIELVRKWYGLDVSVSPLVSERDQNFRLRTADGRDYVLKIANPAEAPEVTDFQIQALLYIAESVRRQEIPIRTPQILKTREGANYVSFGSAGSSHVARVVTFLPGKPLAIRTPSPALSRNMGACLAWLGRALKGFSHPGSRQSLLWDLQQALQVRRLLTYIPEPDVLRAVTAALDDFEQHAKPALPLLRSQVIHNDLNPDNVLVEADDSDTVAGVIDFGDMLEAPLVIDAAIGASYQRTRNGDPLRLVTEFLRGYTGVTPLMAEELDILFTLIQARLSTSIAILEWRASMRGSDDPYLEKTLQGEASAKRFLLRLQQVRREDARQVLSAACAVTGPCHRD